MRFVEMMDLAAHGPDTFVGHGPHYPWGGLYGGQIVAQALRAAAATVDPSYRVHSLHAYFIRPGDHTQSVRFEVDRLRNGRSFVTRSVVARQEAAILHMAASFQVQRPVEVQRPVRVPGLAPGPPPGARRMEEPPGAGPDDSWSPMFQRTMLPGAAGQARAWMRVTDDLVEDPILAACALAYLSDDLPSDALRSLAEVEDPLGDGERWAGVSLDHAIWFQRPVTPGWQLHELGVDGRQPPRGLSTGRIHGPGGEHLATVAQELLLRRSR